MYPTRLGGGAQEYQYLYLRSMFPDEASKCKQQPMRRASSLTWRTKHSREMQYRSDGRDQRFLRPRRPPGIRRPPTLFHIPGRHQQQVAQWRSPIRLDHHAHCAPGPPRADETGDDVGARSLRRSQEDDRAPRRADPSREQCPNGAENMQVGVTMYFPALLVSMLIIID